MGINRLVRSFGILFAVSIFLTGCALAPNQSPLEPVLAVYVCYDGDTEICVVDLNNKTTTQLTFNETRDESPDMNRHGQIAFTCSVDSHEICLINADGTGIQQLTSNTYYEISPSINDAGQIAFECHPNQSFGMRAPLSNGLASDICVVNHDGSGYKNLTELFGRDARQPSINNAGVVSFECEGDEFTNIHGLTLRPTNLCTIQADGSTPLRLTDHDSDDVSAQIHDDGQILYACAGDWPTSQICLINSNGSGFRAVFPEAVDVIVDGEARMNERGEIAFGCRPDGFSLANLCVINSDGSGFRQLELASGYNYVWVHTITDDGQILFGCHSADFRAMCAVNFDNSNERHLDSWATWLFE